MPPVVGQASALAVDEVGAGFLVDRRCVCWLIGVDGVANWWNLLDSEFCKEHFHLKFFWTLAEYRVPARTQRGLGVTQGLCA